jgi:hypothetical protein
VAGVPLADFLRARLARYVAGLPVPRARLPIRIELVGGEVRATPVEEAPPAAPAAGDARIALAALEGPAAERRWAEARARLAALEAEEEAARRRAEAVAARLADDVASGALVPSPDPAQSARELGRPPVQSPAGALALGALSLAATLAAAWAAALPMLLAAGSYPPHLEPGPDALAPALAITFALGVAVGLLALALDRKSVV